MSSRPYTVGEGSSVTVKVTLSADPERTVTVPITRTNQGGASDTDYSGVPSGLTFDSGETEKSFSFTAVQDTDDDDDESVGETRLRHPAHRCQRRRQQRSHGQHHRR